MKIKDKKLAKNLYYLLSLMCYSVSILFFTKSSSNGMGVMWLGFGTICLSFAKKLSNNKDE